MPSNTTYNPVNSNEFEKTKLNKFAQGIQSNPTLNGISNLDLLLTDDVLMTGGGAVLISNATLGDYMDFQIVVADGQGGYIVLKQFITSWFIDPTNTQQPLPKSIYPAKIPAGFILRVVYHSTATDGPTPWVAVNFDLEKVLI